MKAIFQTIFARLLILAMIALSPAGLSSAKAQLLNGGFETFTTGAGAAIANWTTTAQYNRNTNPASPNGIESTVVIAGAVSLDLWSGNNATQTFSMATPLAKTYSLSVTVSAYTNNGANTATQSFTLSLGNQSQTFTTAASSTALNAQTFTLTNIVLAATNNVVTITDNSGAHSLGYVLLVDSFTLTPTPAPIPGAGAPSFIGVALAGLALKRRRLSTLLSGVRNRLTARASPMP